MITDFFIPHRLIIHKLVNATLLHKTDMRLAITDNRAVNQQLCDNFGHLDSYMDYCKSDMKMFLQFFDTNYSVK